MAAETTEDRYQKVRRQRQKNDPRVPEMPVDDVAPYDEMIGGAMVQMRGNRSVVDFNPGMSKTSNQDSDEHSANIVDQLDESFRVELVSQVMEQVDADIESRSDWQKRVDQAMVLLGLTNVPLDELPFEGASAVTYPLIGEACVQFQARAIEEVFPSEGPAKTKIIGERTTEKEEQAERVQYHMNYQMVDQDRAYFWNTDQMLFWLPLAGSCFKKTYYDPISDMVVSRLVHGGDFIVPYTATDLHTASRYTHRLWRTDGDLKRLMGSGFYRVVDLSEPSTTSLDTQSDDKNRELRDAADDRQPSLYHKDHIYEILEMHCDLEIEMDQDKYIKGKDAKEVGIPLPYIVTVNRTDETLLSIRRNWRENDELFEKRMWFTHYRYLPGLGFYGFGLLHLIGSIAEASTGTIRALLDSAAFANMQGGFVSDEAQLPVEDTHISPGVYRQVKMSSEELQRAFYTPPFKEPSPALAKLFEILTETGRRFASITEEMTGDAPNTGPVGTTIALIEQGSKVFSGVHRRLHTAQAEEFSLRAELNFEFLDEEYPYEIEGQDMLVLKMDYDGRVDVVPVSDPNIFSSTQRIAQAQAMMELAEKFPSKFDLDEALRRFLKAIKVPDIEELLSGDKQTMRFDPITENMMFMVGSGSKAFSEQDHDAHIQVHMMFIQGLNEDGLAVVGPIMQAHLAEHYALKYYNEVNQMMGGQLPPPTFMDQNLDEDDELDPETEIAISQMAAQLPPIQLMPPSEDEQDDEEAEFQAEEARKQMAFDSEESRKQVGWEAEMKRKDMAVQYDADRGVANEMTSESRKDRESAEQIQRDRANERSQRLEKDRQTKKDGRSGDS